MSNSLNRGMLRSIAAGIGAITLAIAVACGQPSAAQPAPVKLTSPPPAVNTVVQATDPTEATPDAPPRTNPQDHAQQADAPQPAQPEQPAPVEQPTHEQIVAAHDAVMSDLYDATVPSVVGLRVLKTIIVGGNMPRGMPNDFSSRAAGSGFIWDDEGHIVTNRHVVIEAERIIVMFSDGVQADAELVGHDPDSDLAVIKITDESVRPPPIAVGDSDEIRPGQLAVAIGDPFSRGFSMTSGIISAVGRTINPMDSNFSVPRVVQHDAATNPGNSGGPLLNREGEVIGINTQIISETGAFSGVGLAIPINLAKLVVPALISDGRYDYPYIGIRGATVRPDIAVAMDLPAETRGALVIAVGSDTAASRGGLRASDQLAVINGAEVPVGGDIIVAIDGTSIQGMDDVIAYVIEHTQPGDTVEFTVLRDGEEVPVDITMGKRPG